MGLTKRRDSYYVEFRVIESEDGKSWSLASGVPEQDDRSRDGSRDQNSLALGPRENRIGQADSLQGMGNSLPGARISQDAPQLSR